MSNAVGYAAGALVLATFVMTDMRNLRTVALFSNIAFLAYGALEGIYPVLVLHLLLLPINSLRLLQAYRVGKDIGPRIAKSEPASCAEPALRSSPVAPRDRRSG